MEDDYVLQLADSRFKELFLCFCGYAQCQPLHYFGPAVRQNYLIHVVLDGKGIFQVGEQRYEISKGMGFIIEPDVTTFYQADEQEPWTYLWIGFDGLRARECMQDMGMLGNRPVFRTEQAKELKGLVLQMLKQEQSSISGQYHRQSLLFEFFSLLTRGTEICAGAENEKKNENFYMERAVSYIRNHYASGIKVQDLVDYVCVDRSYLYKMFEKTFQMSPKEFLSQFRISRAKEMLTLTELSVEEVAAACGFVNGQVLAKNFRKQQGMTPTEYRREHRKEVSQRLRSKRSRLEQMLEEEQEPGSEEKAEKQGPGSQAKAEESGSEFVKTRDQETF